MCSGEAACDFSFTDSSITFEQQRLVEQVHQVQAGQQLEVGDILLVQEFTGKPVTRYVGQLLVIPVYDETPATLHFWCNRGKWLAPGMTRWVNLVLSTKVYCVNKEW